MFFDVFFKWFLIMFSSGFDSGLDKVFVLSKEVPYLGMGKPRVLTHGHLKYFFFSKNDSQPTTNNLQEVDKS